jgi:membrane protease YdiL (CAAX protease family)
MLTDATPRWRVREFVLSMTGGLAVAVVVGVLTAGQTTPVFLVSTALAQYGGHLATAWALGRSRGGWTSLGLRVEGRDSVWLLAGVALQVVLPLLIFPLVDLISEGEGGQVIGDEVRSLDSSTAKLLIALTIAVLAPVTEELLFRGILLQAILPAHPKSAPWIVALVFAVFHIFGLAGDIGRALLLTMPVFFVIGLILALLTIRRQRLGPAIFLHAGFNLLGLLLLFVPEDVLNEALRQVTTTTSSP